MAGDECARAEGGVALDRSGVPAARRRRRYWIFILF